MAETKLANFAKNRYFKLSLIYVFILYSCISVVYLAILITNKYVIAGSDLVSFLTGSRIISVGRGNLLYDVGTQYKYQLEVVKPIDKLNLLPFRSLPFVALVYLPFLNLQLNFIFWIFIAVNLLLIYLTLRLLGNLFPNPGRSIYSKVLPLVFYPTIAAVSLGQNVFIMVLALILIYKFITNRKFFWAGIAGGAILFKVQYLLILLPLFFYVKDKKKFLLGFLLSASALMAISLFITGWRELMVFPLFLSQTETVEFGSRYFHMFSVYSFFSYIKALSSYPKELLVFINLLIFFAVSAGLIIRRKSANFDIVFMCLLILGILFAGHSLAHDLSLLIPLFYILDRVKVGWGFLIKIVLFVIPLTFFLNAAYLGTMALIIIFVYLFNKLNVGDVS